MAVKRGVESFDSYELVAVLCKIIGLNKGLVLGTIRQCGYVMHSDSVPLFGIGLAIARGDTLNFHTHGKANCLMMRPGDEGGLENFAMS